MVKKVKVIGDCAQTGQSCGMKDPRTCKRHHKTIYGAIERREVERSWKAAEAEWR